MTRGEGAHPAPRKQVLCGHDPPKLVYLDESRHGSPVDLVLWPRELPSSLRLANQGSATLRKGP